MATQQLVVLIVVLLSGTWEGVLARTQYMARNRAADKAGGQRFEEAVGESEAENTMASASQFIQQIFGYTENTTYAKKQVETVTLYVDDEVEEAGAEAETEEDGSNESAIVHLSQSYVGTYADEDVETEVKGVLYREMARVWQWSGQGSAQGKSVRDGIADYVRLLAGLASSRWVKPGQGDRWDQGDDVTAYFLQYCESQQPGFVASLNAKMASGRWDASYFQELTGQSVDQLWTNYKKNYAM
ncbi:hypothetical protein GOP47_0004643 [Adiantum capillus-veneris]|uniref:Uncharacterized protein n=1 Tax=Adiantum capillus-veneris TaxID=13818 RepID=A0A9D4ZQI3_ADICA|nr:hypothetical protein GOP47_0004643 [Adiantum capillus-veneris]